MEFISFQFSFFSQVCLVDPKKNALWRALRNHIKTDDVHLNDQLNFQSDSKGKNCFDYLFLFIFTHG